MYDLEDVKKRSLLTILTYLIFYLIVGSIATILIIKCYETDTYSYKTILNAMSAVSGDYSLDKIAAACNVWSMAISYIPVAVLLILIMHIDLIEDFKKLKEKPIFNAILAVAGGLVLFLVVFLLGMLIEKVVGYTSTNEETLESVFAYKKYGVFMLLITSIFGPIVEELVYRKAIFNLLNDKPKWIPIVVSIVAFVLPHMLSTTDASFGEFLLISVPYIVSAAIFAFAYEISGRNVYVTMVMHFINNLITCIILLA